MNELIKYKNEMNTLSFSGFSAVDQDLFMALCARMKDKNTQEITFDFATLRKIVDYPAKWSNKQFERDLLSMVKRLNAVNCTYETDEELGAFTLFPIFRIPKNKGVLIVGVAQKFAWLLNDFTQGGYTQLELKRFINLSGKYSKTIYRYLRQYRSTGFWRVGYEDFRSLLGIPASYKPRNINQKVLEPALAELSKYFTDLKCEPFYLPKQGAPLGGYTFTFTGDNDVPGQLSLDEVAATPPKGKPKNKFKNFEERTYDYTAIEEQLYNQPLDEKS